MSEGERAETPPPVSTRPTLGLVTDSLGDSCRGPAWLGFNRAAQRLNVHALTFVGYAPERGGPHSDYVYQMANAGFANGLALNLRACEKCRYDEERRFLARFTQRPLLGFGRSVPEFPCIAYDQRGPIEEVVTHLVNVHNRKRIALLAADPAWDHASGRTEAFRNALQASGIPVDETLIRMCTQEPEATTDVLKELFGEGVRRPDALITSSDRSAYQALADLAAMGIHVPDEVAVVGCGDLLMSRFWEPPLTTVKLDEQTLAEEACRLLMKWVAGSSPGQSTLLPTRVDYRETCGCYSRFGRPLAAQCPITPMPLPSSLDDFHERLEGRLSVTLRFISRAGSLSADEVEGLLGAFFSAIKKNEPDLFLRELVRVMRATSQPGRSSWIWVRVLLDMKDEAQALPRELDVGGLAVVLLEHGLRVAHSFAWRRDRLKETRQAQNWSDRQHHELPLLRAHDLRGIRHAAASVADELGIGRYAVCVECPNGDEERELRVCLAGRSGAAMDIEPEGRPLPKKTVLPDFLFPAEERSSALIHPLTVHGLNGFILLEQRSEDWVAYHEFAEHLGAALRGVRTLWKVEEQASHLAAANVKMQNEVRERRQAEERLANSVAGLRGILVASSELMQAADSDSFYRRAIELAREQLGLERCSLWVPMDESDRVRGTFGTNRQGRTVDESYVVRVKGPAWREMDRAVSLGEPYWMKLAGHPHVHIEEVRVVEIGHGWTVATPVFGGRKLLGAFYNDTAISGAPLDETRQELIFVYCAMLGSLMLSRAVRPQNMHGTAGG